MKEIIYPEAYKSKLSIYETQQAICLVKQSFEEKLRSKLNLLRVSAPLFVDAKTGLNDNLSGVERPVSFDVPSIENANAEVVHSLAKWKRMALYNYNFKHGEGLYTDMNAIRRDEKLDNIHSIYVDQWDWEKIISESERNFDYLKLVVKTIVESIYETSLIIKEKYPQLAINIEKNVYFISSEELRQRYPDKSPKEREYLICKEYKTVFLSQIGKELGDGTIHDTRAADYDDWELNGDILFYNELLDIPFEISSMGIRVDSKSLKYQLEKSKNTAKAQLNYHKMILNNELPLTIGGGVGQSRLCMLLLEKCHIGEVQSSIWDDETVEFCKENKINLL